jgi:hypothetical protein
MAVASFAGISLGLAVTTQRHPAPYRVQRNTYAGVDGWQSVRLGKPGVEVAITARIYAGSALAFGALYAAFEALMDGNSYPLVDTYGISPPGGAELVGFGPAEERVRQDSQLGFSLRVQYVFLCRP